jgi:Xaa-Pro aminopeptidase
MNQIVSEKSNQVKALLTEFGIDLWLTFVRETSAGMDPVLPLIYGDSDLTWQSALLFTKDGYKCAIVGRFEVETAENTGAFDRVIPYDESIQPLLLEELDQINPEQIAINFSKDDVLADGLCHGMYLNLMEMLHNTPYKDRIVSAERIIRSLRGRKTKTEIELIKKAIDTTLKIYETTFPKIQIGMQEMDVAHLMHEEVNKLGLGYAWPKGNNPAVNTGPNSPVGHNAPTDLRIEPGHLLHFDFGVRENDYCADIQRMVYVRETGEKSLPAAVQKGFTTVVKAIQAAFSVIKPGVPGVEVDKAARQVVIEAGYPEYKYATGHQLGRLAHDGGGILGPDWPRYRDLPFMQVEEGQVYTLEPGLMVPGHGYVGIEEDILVTENGAVFLSPPQTELVILE